MALAMMSETNCDGDRNMVVVEAQIQRLGLYDVDRNNLSSRDLNRPNRRKGATLLPWSYF